MYHKGQWQGEPCNYRILEVIVGDEPEDTKDHFAKHYPNKKRYLWFMPFIGQKRQVIECNQHGQIWYMDNADGSGLHKIKNGGWPNLGHSSIYPEQILRLVPITEWVEFSAELVAKRESEVDDGWMKIDPIGYQDHKKEIAAILASIRKLRP